MRMMKLCDLPQSSRPSFAMPSGKPRRIRRIEWPLHVNINYGVRAGPFIPMQVLSVPRG
jgi:hypothetical protein